jgi:hypothetical protein
VNSTEDQQRVEHRLEHAQTGDRKATVTDPTTFATSSSVPVRILWGSKDRYLKILSLAEQEAQWFDSRVY